MEEERGQAKMQGIVCGLSSLFQPSLIQHSHPQTQVTQTQRARETAQVTDDQMKGEAVNSKWMKEGCHHRGFG